MTLISDLPVPGYSGYRRLHEQQHVTGREQATTKYADFVIPPARQHRLMHQLPRSTYRTENDRFITEIESNGAARSHSATQPSRRRSVFVHSPSELQHLWKSVAATSYVPPQDFKSSSKQSSSLPVDTHSPISTLPVSCNMLHSAANCGWRTGYQRDLSQSPLERTRNQPSILQMASTSELFSGTSKAYSGNQQTVLGYAGHTRTLRPNSVPTSLVTKAW